tara:strand:+ start:330 stop:518 length:189 start_codon:yes stop_codon:yes gene_type:complete
MCGAVPEAFRSMVAEVTFVKRTVLLFTLVVNIAPGLREDDNPDVTPYVTSILAVGEVRDRGV